MPIKMGAFVARLPHLTHAEFKTQYEAHIKLISSIFGKELFPVYNRRHYTSPDRRNFPDRGPESTPTYDAYTINVFRDQKHLDDFVQRYKEKFDIIDADERKFIDQKRMSFAFIDVEETKGTSM